MASAESDMSGYFNALEEFKTIHSDKIIKNWGSIEKFDEFIESSKAREAEIYEYAKTQYGSIGNYAEAMKKNLLHLNNNIEQLRNIKEKVAVYKLKSEDIFHRLTSDLEKDPACDELQGMVNQLVAAFQEAYGTVNFDIGNNYWTLVTNSYLTDPKVREVNDRLYGDGAALLIGNALKYYFDNA